MDKTGEPCPDCDAGKLYPTSWWSRMETKMCKKWKCLECGCEESG